MAHGKAALCFAVLLSSVNSIASAAQNVQSQTVMSEKDLATSQAEERVKRTNNGDLAFTDLEQIARAKTQSLIPHLETAFEKSADKDTKQKIADVLVRLGDVNPTYWNFLAAGATPPPECTAPSPVRENSRLGISELFTTWAKQQALSVDAALNASQQYSESILFVAEIGDRRGIPLLRQALNCTIPLALGFAARGLAIDKDVIAVPLMLAAAKRVPAASGQIAAALVYFDDSQSQSAVKTYISPDLEKDLREQRTKGLDALGR